MEASLYVLEGELIGLIDRYTNDDFEWEDEGAKESFDKLLKAQGKKLENIIGYIRWLEAMTKAAKEEKMRLDEVRKRYENKTKSLKKYLLNVLGSDFKAETALGKLSFRPSEGVEILEGHEVPIDYCKPTWKTDITKIKNAIKAGEEINFARIEKRFNLNIR